MSIYRIENPATGEVEETFPSLADADVNTCLVEATRAQVEWAQRPLSERVPVLLEVARLFTERAKDLAHMIGREMGKKHSEAVDEAEFSADIFTYYATNAHDLLADEDLNHPGGSAVLQKLPLGVLLGIMPWNFPYYQVARFAAPNLLVGNGIILKHAEICPRSSAAIAQIMTDAGLPAGVYTNVYASHDQISTLVEDRRIAGVSLTGSERAGAIIARQAGENLKKVVLELGGSDPYVILDTDDVKAAATTAWETRMYNTGQACNSNKRIIVMNDVYAEFVTELEALAAAAEPGTHATAGENSYMPLSSRDAAEKLRKQLDEAEATGARVRVGGELAEEGAYISPAVLTDVPVGSEIYYEELFGPVVTVFSVDSDGAAVTLANDTQYGLGAAVFATNVDRAKAVAAQLHAGMVSVNAPSAESAELPFGGVQNSGYGRELGPVGVDEFVNKRLFAVTD